MRANPCKVKVLLFIKSWGGFYPQTGRGGGRWWKRETGKEGGGGPGKFLARKERGGKRVGFLLYLVGLLVWFGNGMWILDLSPFSKDLKIKSASSLIDKHDLLTDRSDLRLGGIN